MEQEKSTLEVIPVDKSKIAKIWKVTAILAVATIIEFIIAFTVSTGTMKTGVFIVLTIVKAFYIVAEFMHLGHEKRSLVNSIVYPLVFIVWLLGALLIQGEAIFTALSGQ